MAWAYQLHARSGELLTSYLARVAHGHGSVAGAFCRLHLGDSWFFTRDIDRGVAVAQHGAIARLSGMSAEQLDQLTLRPWISALTPASYRQALPPAVAPWINAVGIDQARRRHRSVSFCPGCLENGIALKRWRLSFHTWCDEHARPLLDGCPRCGAEFVPHLSRRSIAHCHRCGSSMVRSSPTTAASAHGEAAELQRCMDAWLSRASAGEIHARDRLYSLRVLVSVALGGSHGQALRALECSLERDADAGRLETLPINRRLPVLAWLARCQRGWPTTFHALAEAIGLTQQSFVRSGLGAMQCGWLKSEVQKLPPGHPRRGPRRRTEVVAVSKAALDAGNWRARRAELLMRKVVARGH